MPTLAEHADGGVGEPAPQVGDCSCKAREGARVGRVFHGEGVSEAGLVQLDAG
ncbi:MAG: hypothetical protein ACTSU5_01955 [Promethearchaeota archaeon]